MGNRESCEGLFTETLSIGYSGAMIAGHLQSEATGEGVQCDPKQDILRVKDFKIKNRTKRKHIQSPLPPPPTPTEKNRYVLLKKKAYFSHRGSSRMLSEHAQGPEFYVHTGLFKRGKNHISDTRYTFCHHRQDGNDGNVFCFH